MNEFAVAQFEKVPVARYVRDRVDNLLYEVPELRLQHEYDNIHLPKRVTSGSAGYDICSPFDFVLNPGETILIPTGLRVNISAGWFMAVVPRSSLGFNYRAQLDNTIGIIDADYYNAANFGHIMIKLTNTSFITNLAVPTAKTLRVDAGDRIVQGILIPYGITRDDSEDEKECRTGGMGSTGV